MQLVSLSLYPLSPARGVLLPFAPVCTASSLATLLAERVLAFSLLDHFAHVGLPVSGGRQSTVPRRPDTIVRPCVLPAGFIWLCLCLR